MAKASAMSKILKVLGDIPDDVVRKDPKIAQKILDIVNSPEVSTKLPGSVKGKYLDALDVVQGDRAKRAKDMGFLDDIFYHGTKSQTPIDEVDMAALNPSSSQGGGFYTSKNKVYPNIYGDKTGGSVYPLRISGKIIDSSQPITQDQVDSLRKILPSDVFDYLKSNGDLDVGKSKIGNALRRAGYENKGFAGMYERPHNKNIVRDFSEESGISALDNEPKETVVLNPKNIRSTNAAFDTRFADSAKLLAGAGAIPAVNMNPLNDLSDAVKQYQGLKDAIAQKIGKQLDLTKDGSGAEDAAAVMSFALDPVNLIPGGAGVAASLTEAALSGMKSPLDRRLNKLKEGK